MQYKVGDKVWIEMTIVDINQLNCFSQPILGLSEPEDDSFKYYVTMDMIKNHIPKQIFKVEDLSPHNNEYWVVNTATDEAVVIADDCLVLYSRTE